MLRMYDWFGTHWLEVLLLGLAAHISVGLFRRCRWAVAWAPMAIGSALFAVGSVSLSGWKFIAPELTSLGFTRTKFDVAAVILLGTASLAILLFLFLLVSRRWSYRLGWLLLGVGILATGGWLGRPLSSGVVEVATSVRYTVFVRPGWLVLLVFVPVVVLIARRSLSGLGRWRKWAAITARALAVAGLVLALAEPRFRRPSEDTTVIFVVDRSSSVPKEFAAGGADDLRWERVRKLIVDSVKKRGPDKRNDQAGLIIFGKRPRLVLPPTSVEWLPVDDRLAGPIDINYTDIAAALKLAMASFPEGTGKRIVLVSDGNPNLGNVMDQAELARKNGVQIDTLTLAPDFRNENEVLVTEVDAPTLSGEGDRRLIRVAVRNENPDREVDGLLELVRVGRRANVITDSPDRAEQVPIDTSNEATNRLVLDATKLPARVRLLPKLNVFRFVDRERGQGESSYTYKAKFTPLESRDRNGVVVSGLPGDRTANNSASAAVIARGRRRVLFLDPAAKESESPHRHLLATMRAARHKVDHWPVLRLPAETKDLGIFLSDYDCIILANVPAEVFSDAQMETIRTQVHDQGCGLIMLGGPDSFGPGGYQQTAVEAALPVDCEIKSKRAMGKGGLILIMHASEMADGNKWQKEIAKLAIQRLNPNDMVGVYDFGLFGVNNPDGVNPQIPFQVIESKEPLYAQIDRMSPGDMPDFDPFLRDAASILSDPKYNLATKHVILISDGDPNYSGPGMAAVKKMAANGITCTTVGVATHGVSEDKTMAAIAAGTRDANGKTGAFYKVTDPKQLPAIYIKESRRISQSFIYDKPFQPQLRIRGGATADLRDDLPTLRAFVRTTKKESLLAEMLIEGPPDQDQQFPVLASWRYGLGKAIAYTSDARTIPDAGVRGWDQDWVASDVYVKFWEASLNWAMREAERGRLTLLTEYRDGRVRVRVDAQDEKGKPVMGLSLRGAVTPPSKPAAGDQPPQVEFTPVGGGQYVAEFVAEDAGVYFVNVQGTQVQVGPDGKVIVDPTGRQVVKSFDSARAGVAVPYSPEYADLESNANLMKEIAEKSDGKAIRETDDLVKLAESGEFFRRGPRSVKSVLPFWYWLVFGAGLLVLVDVGVRRISLEAKEVSGFASGWWARRRAQTAGEEVESDSLDALLRRKQSIGDAIDKKRAARKFEPDGMAIDAAPPGADEYVGRTAQDSVPASSAPGPGDSRGNANVDDEDDDDFMTRMRKAKDRGKKK